MSKPYRFLLASWGGPGNLSPLLTAARRLRAHHHAVRVIADRDCEADVLTSGFDFTPWRRTPSFSDLGSATLMSDPTDFGSFCEEVMFGPASVYAAETLEEFQREHTDALLAIDMLIGSVTAAEAAGVPCAMLSPHISVRPLPGQPSVGSGLMPPKTSAESEAVKAAGCRLATALDAWLPTLNQVRVCLNLPLLDRAIDLYDRPERVLLAMSAAFDHPASHLPENVRYVGPLLDQPGFPKPWTRPWSERVDRPRILVSFSTTFQDQSGPLQRVIDALGRLDVEAVVTTGPAIDPTALRTVNNVHVIDGAPHDTVMEEISGVVTHGGHGTICRSLAHGCPLLVMPMGRDQNDNAARVVSRGVGLTLEPTSSANAIAAAITRLVTEPQFLEAARSLGHQISSDLHSPILVDEMEALASRRMRSSRSSQATSKVVTSKYNSSYLEI